MGNPAQSDEDKLRTEYVEAVPELKLLWDAISPYMREIDYEAGYVDHAICLSDANELGTSTRPKDGVYMSRSCGSLLGLICIYEEEKYYGRISVARAMELLKCDRLDQFHDVIQKAAMGHLRHAEERAREKQRRLSDARAGIAKLRFGDKPKSK